MGYIPERPKGMGIRQEEAELIIESIRSVKNCKLLVFGCGNDTPFWDEVNDGRTAFLENYDNWINAATYNNPFILEIHKVEYFTVLSKWEEYYAKDDLSFLAMDLPEEILNTKWDVVLVDSPVGRDTKTHTRIYGTPAPGRMQSIYMANQLVKDNGTVFIHDILRPAERNFGHRIFGKNNLETKISYLGKYIKKVFYV